MNTLATKLRRTCSAIRHDEQGNVFAETAIIMPIFIMLLLGGYDVARLALLQQKLSRTTIATADMVSQGETTSQPEVDAIMTATSTMMTPFSTGAAQRVIVSSVSTTGASAPAKVDWQRQGGGTLTGVTSKLGASGANATLPAGFLVRNGENVIVAEIYYHYEATFLPDLFSDQTLYHRAMLRPRVTSLSTLCVITC